MRILFFIILNLLVFSSQAELYKWVDKNGETIYSDEPPHDNAQPLEPPPLVTTPAIKYKPKAKAENQQEKKEKEDIETIYSSFKITSPANDETLRDNAGNITVSLAITPKLDVKAGHSISVLLNSQSKIEGSTGLTIGLKNIDRGTHSIQAIIKNKQKKIIKSTNSVTIHMRRFSKLRNKPAP